jgi:hypothetical protein
MQSHRQLSCAKPLHSHISLANTTLSPGVNSRPIPTTHSRLVPTTHDRIDTYHGLDVAADYDDVAGKAAGMPDISLRWLRWR